MSANGFDRHRWSRIAEYALEMMDTIRQVTGMSRNTTKVMMDRFATIVIKSPTKLPTIEKKGSAMPISRDFRQL